MNQTMPKSKLTLLNTTIATQPGRYSLESYSLDQARSLVMSFGENVQSAIGHSATAAILTDLLGGPQVPVNRIEYRQMPGELALCFKLKGRPPEGAVLSIEQIEEIGYEFQLLRRLPEWTRTSVVVHGSVLRGASFNDVDVIATEDTPEVRAFISDELQARGWGHRPVDVQIASKVPALPYCQPGPVLTLAGPALEQRVCWDLSAWVRACELSELARQEYLRLLTLRFDGGEHLDSRFCGVDKPGIVFVAAENPGLTGAYHGGGRQALLTAQKKAPFGWTFCTAQLPPGAQALLTKWLETGALPPSLSRYLHTAPSASNRELWLNDVGLLGAYAASQEDCWPWSKALEHEDPPQPAVCGMRGDGAFGGPRTE